LFDFACLVSLNTANGGVFDEGRFRLGEQYRLTVLLGRNGCRMKYQTVHQQDRPEQHEQVEDEDFHGFIYHKSIPFDTLRSLIFFIIDQHYPSS
jgi:hypothetical protein